MNRTVDLHLDEGGPTTNRAHCYNRPDLAEAKGQTFAQLVASRERCGTCPVRSICPEIPGYMCAGRVCVAAEKNGMQRPYTVTVEWYALKNGLLPKRRRRNVPPVRGQLPLFPMRQPRTRKQVAA